jgi:hypothetical protein
MVAQVARATVARPAFGGPPSRPSCLGTAMAVAIGDLAIGNLRDGGAALQWTCKGER